MKPKVILCLALVLSGALALSVSCTHSARDRNEPAVQQLPTEIAAALNAKNYAKAQVLAGQLIRSNPDFGEAWVEYGIASVKLGDTNQARQAYERALSLYQARHRQHPAEANSVVQQIFLLELLGRSDEAGALLKSARTNYPDDQQVLMLTLHWTEVKRSFENW